MSPEETEQAWRNITEMCMRNGHAVITEHIARGLREACAAGPGADKLRDRIAALEHMLGAAHRRIAELESEVQR